MDLGREETGAAALDVSGLRFNSVALDELSEELKRCSEETQRLQEEVEHATKSALEKIGYVSKHFYQSLDDSSHQQSQRDVRLTIKAQDTAHLQHFSDDVMHLCEMCNPHDQDKTASTLQTRLQRVQIERDILSDLRVTDLRRHVDQTEKMLRLLEELQVIKRSGDVNLQEAQHETFALSKKLEALEGTVKDLSQTLLPYEKTHITHHSSITAATFHCLNDQPQETSVLPVEHKKHRDPSEGLNDRMDELIASLDQEVAMLNHKLNSSQDSGVRVSTKLELLRRSLQQQLKTGDLKFYRPQEEVQNPGGEREQSQPEQPSRLEEAQRDRGTPLTGKESLRLELEDRDKLVEMLGCQLKKSDQTISGLHQENALLRIQTKQLEVGHLESLEKQQLAITEDLHSCACDEYRGAVLRLRGELKSTQMEVDQVRGALGTLKGEQPDTLQARVQHLEKMLLKVDQERADQNAETQRQGRELAFVRKEKRQLARELHAVRSKDKHFRAKIGELETIVHKMTKCFTKFQDFIQLNEQEFLRLKLKHFLDLKEFQGENVTPPGLDSLIPSTVLADPHPSTRDARNAQIKARDQVSQNLGGPHNDNAVVRKSFEQAKAAPQRMIWASEIETTDTTPGHLRSRSVTMTRNALYPWRQTSGRRSPVYALLTSEPGLS
ncbi:coiled-coil domain-containing protein 158-like isoform X3 [Syngnathoides biaculeatus]|uniref:coiled-coil domain-containing protein 158-like isoform X3 n=1 Tax=Syngnathoides biaculeatus TaxID=300417 RepID=UPI002ADDAFA8|nr:coiled-coil domain-containing protein 158-like isoform X3 [Syngnathoides biaculeatus]